VIIPILNSPLIQSVLEALRRQTIDLSSVEIIVVGIDETGLVAADKLVKLIPTRLAAPASQKRNLGMREAQGDIFCFLDSDCLPAPNWLERHLRRHELGEQVVGGSVTFDASHYWQLADNVSAFHDLLPYTPEGLRPYLATANLSVQRAVAEKAGMMWENLNRAEDLEWTVRFRMQGFRLYFDPRAVVLHNPPRRKFSDVWKHWTDDAHDTLSIRLRYADLLDTPRWAEHRWLYRWGALLIAGWATAHTFRQSHTLRTYWRTLPVVYITKLAWCCGAFKHFPVNWAE